MGIADLGWLANLPGQAVQNPNASGNSGQMNAGSNYASATDPDLLRQLAQIRQSDPNASLVYAPPQEGQSGGTYSISFDQGKMPAVPHAADGQLWARHPEDYAASLQRQMDPGDGSPAIQHSVIDPSKNIESPYGTLTPGSNVSTRYLPTKLGALDTYGPMVVSAATLGAGAAFGGLAGAGAGAGGELGASAGVDVGSSLAGTVARGVAGSVPQLAASAGDQMPVPLSAESFAANSAKAGSVDPKTGIVNMGLGTTNKVNV